MLTGEAGRVSSKRGVMVWLLLLFTFVCVYNVVTGKVLNEVYANQLFELLVITIVTVFGEKWLTAWFAAKTNKLQSPDSETKQPRQ
jgi:hypothetical protein